MPLAERRQLLKHYGRLDDDPPRLKVDDAAALPLPQASIDAFTRAADHAAEFALRERYLQRPVSAGRTRLVDGGAHQHFREANGQFRERHFRDSLIGMTQPVAQDFHQLEADLRVTFEKRQYVTALEHHHLAIGKRHRIGRTLAAIEQRDLPEYLARGQV